MNSLFKEILNSIGADGTIEINEESNIPKLIIHTQFGLEEPRPIAQHSSGQKQAGIIALVLALQTQSVTPITAIDEFDRGLDPVSKRNLILQIPNMISRAMELKESDFTGKISPQFILVAPDISLKEMTEGMNYITCVKTKNNTVIA